MKLLSRFAALTLLSMGIMAGETEALETRGYIPAPEEWQDHAAVLEKYWLNPAAFGTPLGKFPTWRCNDGSLITPESFVCPDDAPSRDNKMPEIMKQDYVRMISRQTFAYGALFNLTGNPECLRLHKAGVRYLLEYARDPEGVFYTVIDSSGKGAPEKNQRTSQDLSYALAGLAMNAYLTHDPKVIAAILNTEKYLFNNYYDREKQLMKWVLADSPSEKTDQKELVAALDQLNAYMLLIWRLLPETETAEFRENIAAVLSSMKKHYLREDGLSFRGCLERPECSGPNAKHSDYGHTVKGFTMELLAASYLGDKKTAGDAWKGMLHTVQEAATPDGREWYENSRKSGASWWVYAELDQAALTLALTGKYDLGDSLKLWLTKYTDRKYGEVRFGRKQHLWRNGMHSAEHALWGYITSQGIRAQACSRDKVCRKTELNTPAIRTELYFSNSADSSRVFPYQFAGDISAREELPGGIVRVSFKNIRLPDALK